jgi:hypothetical protein
MAATDKHATTEVEAVFLVRSVPRLYNEEQLQTRQSSANKHVNIEDEEATASKAVTRQQPVKIQQTEKTSYVL